MSPSAVSPGSGQFTLHVTGANFAAGASVTWNGVELETVFISTRQLSATVPSAKVASSGTGSIQVVNPAPKGGASHTIYFPVAAPAPAAAFAQSNEILTGAFANGIVTADFNRDGQLDVATANDSDSVSVLLGNGGGSFQTAVNDQGPSNAEAFAVVTGDFNNDGKLDLAVVATTETHPGFVYILLGKGDGTFEAPGSPMAVTSVPRSIATADFDRDGNLDLAVTNANTNTVSIFLGKGDGTFGARTDLARVASHSMYQPRT